MSPEFPYLRSGMYVTLATTLINEWDYVSPQLYNQGGDGFWTAGVGMVSANMADKSVYLREMYKAFVDPAFKQFGVVFSQSQFVLGLPATNWAAGSGYCAPADIESAVSQLKAVGYSPRGVMDWSVNWDATACYSFLGAYKSAFGGSAPAPTTTAPVPTTTAPVPTTSTVPTTSAAPTTSAVPTTTTTAEPVPTDAVCKCGSIDSRVSDAWCQQGGSDPFLMCTAYPTFCAKKCA